MVCGGMTQGPPRHSTEASIITPFALRASREGLAGVVPSLRTSLLAAAGHEDECLTTRCPHVRCITVQGKRVRMLR